jgi:hypothetical protein
VFEGGSVDHEIGGSLVEYLGEQRGIAQVSQYGSANMAAGKGTQLEVNLMEVVFRVFQKNQRPGPFA